MLALGGSASFSRAWTLSSVKSSSVARAATAEVAAGLLKTGATVPTNVPGLRKVLCAHTSVAESSTRRQESATSTPSTVLRKGRRRGFLICWGAWRSAWLWSISASAGAFSSGGWTEPDCEPFIYPSRQTSKDRFLREPTIPGHGQLRKRNGATSFESRWSSRRDTAQKYSNDPSQPP